jgi:hypothetical protein
MADLLEKIPDWLKKEACEHLSEARGHLEQAMRDAKGEEPPDGPRTPLKKEGEF